jgi:hypothetical protein
MYFKNYFIAIINNFSLKNRLKNSYISLAIKPSFKMIVSAIAGKLIIIL